MKMGKKRLAFVAGCTVIGALCISGCGKKQAEAVDLNSMSVEQLEAEAKKEGRVDSVGMPDNWANWVQTWTDLNSIYGLEHSDIDISSAEEIAMFERKKVPRQRISVMWDSLWDGLP